jgi:hypothetical protein
MIVQSIVILLIILIISNIVLGFYNRLHPPCFNAEEYFNGARKMPDGVSSDLGSIPSGTDRNYVGAARVSTGIPGTIGLRSWNKSYVNPNDSSSEDLVNPVIKDAEEQDRMVCEDNYCTIKPSTVSKDAYDAISAAFPVSSQSDGGDTKKKMTKIKGYTGEFEDNFEGIRASNYSTQKKINRQSSGFKHMAETDGYQDS